MKPLPSLVYCTKAVICLHVVINLMGVRNLYGEDDDNKSMLCVFLAVLAESRQKDKQSEKT